jgi:hypothetical protein
MYSVVTAFLNDLNAAGVQGLCYTNLSGRVATAGEWGSMRYVGQPSSQTPKYNALVGYISSPKLQISALATSGPAGAPESFTVTVYNPNGNGADTVYVGTIQFSSTDPQAVLPTSYTFTAADGGVHTFTGTFKTAGMVTLAVTDSTSGLNVLSQITVSPVQAQTLTFAYPTSAFVGVPNALTVTLYDQYGNIATGYRGTVQLTSTDPIASLPSKYTFTSTDAGVHTFTSTLETFGAQTITATDTATPSLSWVASTTVNTLATWDTYTEGNWIGSYGTQGYNVVGSGSQYPPYASVTITGATNTIWASNTSVQRALQTPDGSSRIASAWSAPNSFTVAVNLTDGKPHYLGFYFLDWEGNSRVEQVQLLDAATGAVVDTQTVSSFHGGVYLDWSVAENVLVQITRISGSNAVLSGFFIDPPIASARFMGTDTTTQGNWIGVYGTQGYNVINNWSSLPSYATVTPSGQLTSTWSTTTTTPNALQDAPGQLQGNGRIAACWYLNGSFTVDVNLTDGQLHNMELYLLDYDQNNTRVEKIQLINALTGTVLNTQTVSSFTAGVYLNWTISGHVLIKITKVSGANAVLSGLFFDPLPTPATSLAVNLPTSNFGQAVTLTANVSAPVAGVPSPTGTVEFFDGSNMIGSASLDSQGNASLNVANLIVGTHSLSAQYLGDKTFLGSLSAATTETVAALTPTTSLTLSSPTSNFGQTVTLTANVAAPVAGVPSPTGTVEFFDGSSMIGSAGLDSQGNASLNVANLNVGTHSLSAQYLGDQIFVGSFSAATIETVAAVTNATFLKQDTTTQGNWIGVYGTQGYNVINSGSNIPSYATVTPSGQLNNTWSITTNSIKALQDAPGHVQGNGRIAASWNSKSTFTVDVNMTDGQLHDIELYMLDWPNSNKRVEQIQLSDAVTGTVLDTRTVSSFSGGVYMNWAISGHVLITITSMGGPNGVLSGLFFDPATTS